jgi:hypothetical protein
MTTKKILISEITRINELMGVQVINEAFIPNLLRKIYDEIGTIQKGKKPAWYTDDVKTASNNIQTYYRGLQSADVADLSVIIDDLYTLAFARNDFKDIIGELLSKDPKLKTTRDTIEDIISKKLDNIDVDGLTQTEIDEILLREIQTEYPIRYAAANQGNPPNPDINKLLELIFSKDLVSPILKKKQVIEVTNKVIKNDFTWYNKWYQDGQKIADKINEDVAALAAAKSGTKPISKEAATVLRERIYSNLQFLYRDRKKYYDKLIKDIESITEGVTNTKDAEFYGSVLETVKTKVGDWELIEEVSLLNPTLQKHWNEIYAALKSSYSGEAAFVKFLFSPVKIVTSLYEKIVEKGISEFATQQVKTVGPTLGNWLFTFSPRGLPVFEFNLKNYDDIVQLSGRFPGAYRSYVYEVIIRASKTAGYLSAAFVVYSWYKNLTRNVSWLNGFAANKPAAENCMIQLSEAIKKGDLNFEQTVEYINQGKLTCIYELNLTNESISDMIVVAMYQSGGSGFWEFIGKFTSDLYNRVQTNPKFAGPPIMSLDALFEEFDQKGLGGVIKSHLPEVKIPNMDNPLPIPSVTPTPSPAPPGPRRRISA